MKTVQVFIHKNYDAIKLLILILLAFLAVITILQRIRDNNRQSEDRVNAVEQIVTESKRNTDEIIANAGSNTLILCTLIVRGNLDLNEDEIQEVERICQEEIDRISRNQDTQFTPTPAEETPPAQNQRQDRGSQSDSSSNPTPKKETTQSNNPQTEQPEEEQGLVESATESVVEFLEEVRELLPI